ncbi:MAG TPA: YicC/YloC family endoribonuclease [Alphaproteobacteria bacterium]|nr:YicC/YloC family endoribonuclease [Alphaproteobacteria bacterium]
MKSMTGYGRGECARDGFKITVELGAVNRRQSEISVTLPRELEMLESPVRDAIHARVARGRVTARISVHSGEGNICARMHINKRLAEAYAAELAKLAKQLKLSGGVTLDQIVRAPGVFQSDEELVEADKIWPAVEKALHQALAALVKMREREGSNLSADLSARVGIMRKAVEKIRKQAPLTAENYRRLLIERVKGAGIDNLAADDERLLKEIVLFADRADIAEELTRLQSHFQQFDDCRKSPEPVGRTLDFLAQEMNREINTIGSKANDAIISREVVVLKAELERFREQAQNVE